MKTKNFKAVIWDWNGTLFDDVEHSVLCINKMLMRRGLALLTVEEYRNVFTFPVMEYYKAIGFDFAREAWEEVALEFMNHYWEGMNNVPLFADARKCLSLLQSNNFKQFIISAMEHDNLVRLVNKKGIGTYFNGVMGIENHFAEGKKHLASRLLEREKLCPEEIIWIGDTVHDVEVAREVNVRSRLVLCGHQSKKVIESAGVPSFKTISDCVNSIIN